MINTNCDVVKMGRDVESRRFSEVD